MTVLREALTLHATFEVTVYLEASVYLEVLESQVSGATPAPVADVLQQSAKLT